MVDQQLRARGIADEKVLQAFSKVPRHQFVAKDLASKAYEDRPLPLGPHQTISQPYVVALMLEALKLDGSEKVLEVGSGSGYQTALLADMGCKVFSVEIDQSLYSEAKKRIESLGYKNAELCCADGHKGWKEHAPFDAIIVSASPETIPRDLVKQLRLGGRMILPLGSEDDQALVLLEKTEEGLKEQELGEVRFVPMKEGD